MSTLLIRHLENSDPPRFQVFRAADVKATELAPVPDPLRLSLPARPDTPLGAEAHLFRGYQSRLIFETEEGKLETVAAAHLIAHHSLYKKVIKFNFFIIKIIGL